jgi:hypothetical protein
MGTQFTNLQVAFKAQNAKDESVLRDALWQVSRQAESPRSPSSTPSC